MSSDRTRLRRKIIILSSNKPAKAHYRAVQAGADQEPSRTQTVLFAVLAATATFAALDALGPVAVAFRHLLVMISLGVMLVWTVVQFHPPLLKLATISAVGFLALLLLSFGHPTAAIFGVVLVLAACTVTANGKLKLLLTTLSAAALVVAVYQLLCSSLAFVWLASEHCAAGAAQLATFLSGKPLEIGPSFACLDCLIFFVSLLFFAGIIFRLQSWRRLLWVLVIALVGHLLYLILLAHATDILRALPEPPPPPPTRNYEPPAWHWSTALATVVPWNFPAICCMFYAVLAAVTAVHLLSRNHLENEPESVANDRIFHALWNLLLLAPFEHTTNRRVLAIVLVVLLVVSATLVVGFVDLHDVTIGGWEQGFCHWDTAGTEDSVPDEVHLAALPMLVRSLGGQWRQVSKLSEENLRDLDVLILAHPNRPFSTRQLDQIRNFLHSGKSILVLADTWYRDGQHFSSFDQLLHPAGIHAEFATTIPRTPYWEQGCEFFNHATTAGLPQVATEVLNDFGTALQLSDGAFPLVVGKWGFADAGSDAVLTAAWQWDQHERLGDLILAAAGYTGSGKVVAVADAAMFSDTRLAYTYRFAARTLAFLANRLHGPETPWRKLVVVLVSLLLVAWIVGLLARSDFDSILAIAVAAALAWLCSNALNRYIAQVFPDGTLNPGYNNLVYIDHGNFPAYCDDPWAEDGLAAFQLALIRFGWLPLHSPGIAPSRLRKAAVLVLVAPAGLSSAECRRIEQFVKAGGILVVSAGAEDAKQVNPLLRRFNLAIEPWDIDGHINNRDPVPMGCFITKYRPIGANEDAQLFFHAAWPVRCPRDSQLVLGFGDMPVAAVQSVGAGAVVLIGDSGFMMNKTMWYKTAKFNARIHNATFWRWLLSWLTDQEDWLPETPDKDAISSSRTD